MLLPKYNSHKALSINLDKTDIKFVFKLYKNSNSVASKTQVYYFLHNITYFKYSIAITKKY